MNEVAHHTVLIVDDSPEDRQTYIAFLEEARDLAITFLEAEDLAGARRIIQEAEVDCILLDQMLPDGLGTALIDQLYVAEDRGRLPIVMITGRGSEEVAVAAMKRGAIDYIPKDGVSAESLGRAVRHARRVKDLAGQISEEAHARRLAEHALRAQELGLKALFESIDGVAIVTLDPQGYVVTWNVGARRLFNYHDNDIIGRHAEAIVASGRPAAVNLRGEMEGASRGQRRSLRRWFRRHRGPDFLGTSALSTIADPRGEVRGYAWVVHQLDDEPAPGAAPA